MMYQEPPEPTMASLSGWQLGGKVAGLVVAEGISWQTPVIDPRASGSALPGLVSFMGMNDVTRVLAAIERGDPTAADELLPLVYDELRVLAASRLAREHPGQTLQATALVHEAYLRLVGSGAGPAEVRWEGRGHFFAAAAEAMRRILVDQARRARSQKRGGGLVRHDIDATQVATPEAPADLLALDEALTALAQTDPRLGRLVELRYFAGLTLKQAAEAIGVSPRTADSDWAYAKAFLLAELTPRDS